MREKNPIARGATPTHANGKARTAPSPGDHVKDADEREGKEQEHTKVVEQLLSKRNNCCIASKFFRSLHENIYAKPSQ